MNAIAQLLLKKGMDLVGKLSFDIQTIIGLLPSIIKNAYIWSGIGSYVISLFVWLVVLSRVQVSYAYPFLSLGYIIAAVIGYYYLGESLSVYKITGICVICLGVMILSRG
ncbi:EamA family transporter [Paenibacillus doosanensis]|uniref:EamA family transporter n=1 Tax=Paenibacillus doosanensis TaxID=1229154 RepID=UPI00217F6A16|nr:EamA family transporter [Paenibacillus doosanensis]MCS7464244.1 EamA family transporter [Paenibacillus doosanensis]